VNALRQRHHQPVSQVFDVQDEPVSRQPNKLVQPAAAVAAGCPVSGLGAVLEGVDKVVSELTDNVGGQLRHQLGFPQRFPQLALAVESELTSGIVQVAEKVALVERHFVRLPRIQR